MGRSSAFGLQQGGKHLLRDGSCQEYGDDRTKEMNEDALHPLSFLERIEMNDDEDEW